MMTVAMARFALVVIGTRAGIIIKETNSMLGVSKPLAGPWFKALRTGVQTRINIFASWSSIMGEASIGTDCSISTGRLLSTGSAVSVAPLYLWLLPFRCDPVEPSAAALLVSSVERCH